jgi:hypothetical protein
MLAQDEGLTAPLRTVSQPDGTSPAAQLPRPGTVKARLTPKRPRRQVENDEYGTFARRILRAYSRRVGDGDVEALVLMNNLAEEIDTATAEAVKVSAPMATPKLGRDRRTARHHPPGRAATLGPTVSTRLRYADNKGGDVYVLPLCGRPAWPHTPEQIHLAGPSPGGYLPGPGPMLNLDPG